MIVTDYDKYYEGTIKAAVLQGSWGRANLDNYSRRVSMRRYIIDET